MTSIGRAKQSVRRRVWDLLEREGAAPIGVHGHIPDFTGKEDAAARLAALDVWKQARVIKCNPDRAQLPVRVRALQEGKLLYMAVQRLATPRLINLVTDPQEREPLSLPHLHTWTVTHFNRILSAFQASVQSEPLTPAGAPLDHVPTAPKP